MSNPSTNMSMPIPVVGVESGPAWANEINNCLTILDAHNHTSGYGVPITPSAMNINSDLPINANNLTLARTVRLYNNQSQPSAGTDLGCIYRFGVDLYFNDGNGNAIRMTQSGSIASANGLITGLVAPASAAYVSANQTFVWQSAVNTPANIDAGSVIYRNITASSNGITVSAPAALGSNYSITWPALPGSTLPLSISSAGVMSAATITRTQLATGAVPNISVVNKTGNYTLTSTDDLVTCDASGGAFTITVPASVTGKRFWIQKTDSSFNAVTISGVNINGVASAKCSTQYETVTVEGNGSVYFITSRDYPKQWTSYTPTYTGFGTVSGGSAFWRRIGDSIMLSGGFTAGTPTATEARISFPSGLTSDSTKLRAGTSLCGSIIRGTAANQNNYYALMEQTVTYFTIGIVIPGGSNVQLKVNGNAATGASDDIMWVVPSVPIVGWE